MTFALYKDQQGGAPLWMETQNVSVDANGRYTVLVGSQNQEGLPIELFAAGEARWLGVRPDGEDEKPRVLLVSVAYALKAADAETLGGKPLSSFVLVQGAQSPSSSSTTANSPSGANGTTTPALSSAGTPQAATDFTDNNTTEVVLITQQGSGHALSATSGAGTAVHGEASGEGASAVVGKATSATGTTIGISGQSSSPDGIAGAFENIAGGKILSLRSNGNEVASVNGQGDFYTRDVYAGAFFGDGRGLRNIPNEGTTANSSNMPGSIVTRDANGSFAANEIFAGTYYGDGRGLRNIPNEGTTANSSNMPGSIVARDANGSFAVNEIFAGTFYGNGRGLIGIPNSATTATYAANADTIVARDVNGNFAANQVYANVFFGSGAGLSGVSAQNAQHAVSADTAGDAGSLGGVSAPSFARVDAGNQFSAANTFAGNVDMSGASATLPVKAVLTENTPATCIASKELLVKTDAPSGRQLFICNGSGDGWALVGDGETSSGTVSSISTGQGLTGGPITGTGTIAIADAGVTNSMLQNSAVTVTAGAGLEGGGTVALGGSITLANTGVLSFNGRSGVLTPQANDYSFAQLSGAVTSSQMPSLTGDVTSAPGTTTTSLSASGISAGTYTKLTVDSKGRATAGQQVSFSDVAGSLNPSQLPAGIAFTNGNNNWTGDQVINGVVAAASFSGNGSGLTYVNAAALNGFSAGNFAQLATVNTYAQKQNFAAATGSAASLNLPPSTTTPANPAAGDMWNDGNAILFRDNASTTQSLVSTTQAGGMQLLKVTASMTPSSVSASSCAEQTFTVTGLTTGDVLLSVLQPQTASPGTNIAIGGFRISLANTVVIQFCNVGKSGSTPRAGTYTLALMR